jgi:hypothetical protein
MRRFPHSSVILSVVILVDAAYGIQGREVEVDRMVVNDVSREEWCRRFEM